MSDFGDIVVNLYINGSMGQRANMSSALPIGGKEYTKSEANYRESDTKNDEDLKPRECATCSMFRREGEGGLGTCVLVAGDIHPEYVCDYYILGQELKGIKLVPNKDYYTGKLMD